MLGYKNRPDKSSENYWIDPRDGSTWLRTGDVGRIDEDGFVELIGRTKDVIISGGFNVYPVDLENELVKDPRVAEAAVVGVPSEQRSEEHTSELQSLMRISYAVFCLKKKKNYHII